MKIKQIMLLLLIVAFGSCDKPQLRMTNSFVDSRDGRSYRIMTIGTQTWMGENLQYDSPESIVNPNNPSENYGRLYHWKDLMNNSSAHTPISGHKQGICPDGWHIPSDGEWTTLEILHGMDPKDSISTNVYRGNTANVLKSKTGWVDKPIDKDDNGIDSLGFNGLPAGSSRSDRIPAGIGEQALFWSSSLSKDRHPFTRVLGVYPYTNMGRSASYETTYLSCRCLQD